MKAFMLLPFDHFYQSLFPQLDRNTASIYGLGSKAYFKGSK
jgi:hypothetical protein